MGVWIEIAEQYLKGYENVSLPSWECGLKSSWVPGKYSGKTVAPFVGVWIEIIAVWKMMVQEKAVAPFVGVWIEIQRLNHQHRYLSRRSLRGSVD